MRPPLPQVFGGHLRALISVLALVTMGTPLTSQTLPPLATQGLDALVHGQSDSAVRVWTRAWTSPDDSMKRIQFQIGFQHMYDVLGSPFAYDLIRTVDITPHLHRVYFMVRYRKQPVYLMLALYQTQDSSWVVTSINFNPDPDRVLPPEFFGTQHQGP